MKNNKMETKNTLETIYLDLSKLSEEQIKEIGRLITESGKSIYEDTIQVFTNLTHNPNNPYLVWEDCEHAWMDVCGVGGLTELTYSEFIQLFEGGEGENEIENLLIKFLEFHYRNNPFRKHESNINDVREFLNSNNKTGQ